MFIRQTENFKPGDPATHVKFKRSENSNGKVLTILTPDGQLVPYSPKVHNDATQANGIREGFTIVSMSYRTYYIKTLDQRNSQQGPRNPNPTTEEIDILLSPGIDAYVAEGFDPSKGDANTKWDAKLGHTKNTEILVLSKKIFGYGYQPYKPSQHGTNADDFKPITVNNYRTTRSAARTSYDEWLKKKNNLITNLDIDPMPPEPRIPTQAEIDILLSPVIDAYLAEGFDPSKGDANEKYDSRKHDVNVKILVLKKKIFGYGYQPYNPSQHGTNADEFQPITVNNYRGTRSRAKKAYKKWLGEDNSNIDTTRLLAQIPTQRDIDIFISKKIDAYVTESFDPNKGDDNEKYNSPKHGRGDQILVLKKKLFGGGYEPYIPSNHGTNQKDFKSIKVGCFIKARSRARKAYELWKNNNTVTPSATNSTTSTTTTGTSPTTSNQVAASMEAPDLLLGMFILSPNTLFSTPSATSHPSNQAVGPKRFNPILLINNYESKSETKEQETHNSVEVSQTVSTTQQRKRTADDRSLFSIPSFTRNSFALFQETAGPGVSKDPTEPKRLRPNEQMN